MTFKSDTKQIICYSTNSCSGTILLLMNTYFKKIFAGSEWKLPRPSTIPLRSTGDVKKEMTAKNGGELCLIFQSIHPQAGSP